MKKNVMVPVLRNHCPRVYVESTHTYAPTEVVLSKLLCGRKSSQHGEGDASEEKWKIRRPLRGARCGAEGVGRKHAFELRVEPVVA